VGGLSRQALERVGAVQAFLEQACDFGAQRTHTLAPGPDGQTRLTTEEVFSGPLLPIFGRTIPDLTQNFRGFAAALKARAEA